MPTLTEEIKFRLAPFDKLLLTQIAENEGLDLSDVMRRAARDLIRKEAAVEASTKQRELPLIHAQGR